ncbi:enoyl-CoA delta isomerase 2 [Drosophila takahashii]|uniref:enoyl-CoA delta isomerase 2 n=1 Tax=Drosophila takahashii TaxID=29030 RepID=UPI001CF835FE|nr:uncharacterized protein LOC108058445 [Drosophila takahashii]
MTTDECKHFKELEVGSRSSGLFHIRFKRRWNRRTIYELMRALDLATGDSAVQLVVLSGEFSAGCESEPLALRQGREKRMRQMPSGQQEAVTSNDPEEQYIHEKAANFVMRSLAKKLLAHRSLLVAFVQTECVGLGLSVCSLCDLVFATESAAFVPSLDHMDPCIQVGPGWLVPHLNWLLRLGDRADVGAALSCGLLVSLEGDDPQQEFWHRIEEYARLPISASLLATQRGMLRPWREALLNELRAESTPLAAQQRRLARNKL